jgi:hypothetical protein
MDPQWTSSSPRQIGHLSGILCLLNLKIETFTARVAIHERRFQQQTVDGG